MKKIPIVILGRGTVSHGAEEVNKVVKELNLEDMDNLILSHSTDKDVVYLSKEEINTAVLHLDTAHFLDYLKNKKNIESEGNTYSLEDFSEEPICLDIAKYLDPDARKVFTPMGDSLFDTFAKEKLFWYTIKIGETKLTFDTVDAMNSQKNALLTARVAEKDMPQFLSVLEFKNITDINTDMKNAVLLPLPQTSSLSLSDSLLKNGMATVNKEDWAELVEVHNLMERARWEESSKSNPHIYHYTDDSKDIGSACTEVSMKVVHNNLELLPMGKVNSSEIYPIIGDGNKMVIASEDKIKEATQRVIEKFEFRLIKKLAVDAYHLELSKEVLENGDFGLSNTNLPFSFPPAFADREGKYWSEDIDSTGMEQDFTKHYSDLSSAVMDELGVKYSIKDDCFTDFVDKVLFEVEDKLKEKAEKLKEEWKNDGTLKNETFAQSVIDTIYIIPFKENQKNPPAQKSKNKKRSAPKL